MTNEQVEKYNEIMDHIIARLSNFDGGVVIVNGTCSDAKVREELLHDMAKENWQLLFMKHYMEVRWIKPSRQPK